MVTQINGNGYKLLRNLLVGVATAMVLNIPISIWWASEINTRVKNNTEVIQELKEETKELQILVSDLYCKDEAKADFKTRDDKLEKIEGRLRVVETKLAKLP